MRPSSLIASSARTAVVEAREVGSTFHPSLSTISSSRARAALSSGSVRCAASSSATSAGALRRSDWMVVTMSGSGGSASAAVRTFLILASGRPATLDSERINRRRSMCFSEYTARRSLTKSPGGSRPSRR